MTVTNAQLSAEENKRLETIIDDWSEMNPKHSDYGLLIKHIFILTAERDGARDAALEEAAKQLEQDTNTDKDVLLTSRKIRALKEIK